jgi:OOP family OmpA-OmpF porin
MKKIHRMAITFAALAGSSVANAQFVAPPPAAYPAPPWYIGAGVGQGHLNRSPGDLGLNDATLDDNDTSWTVRGGWRFSPYGAVEVGYYDFGRYNFDGNVIGHVGNVNGSGKAHSVAISLVGILPINQFDLYGRIGYAHSELKFNASGPLGGIANQNDRQDEATYGAGVRWNFHPNWGVFAEWIKNDRIRIDSYVAVVDFRF